MSGADKAQALQCGAAGWRLEGKDTMTTQHGVLFGHP